MKINRSVILAALFLLGANKANASGIPTVDAVAIAQQLLAYTQQLQDYQEMLSQTVLDQSQLLQLVNQYEQTLLEYQHMLKQMEGLTDKFSLEELESVLNNSIAIMSTSPSPIPNPDDAYWEIASNQVGAIYDRYTGLITSGANVNYAGTAANEGSNIDQQIMTRVNVATSQQEAVNSIGSFVNSQSGNILDLTNIANSLGSEDQLKTMQLMAQQNLSILSSLNSINASQGAQLQYSNQLANMANEKAAKQRQVNIQRMLDAQEAVSNYVENTDPLVDF
ncbi:hypothetical protein WH50_06410 [Pokkaliibacter plantistimulans]|uniref:Conjugal transfer protein TrbJ n=1 Tax=Pokkaliibacter plantistimulans TaxID=1635171 RepID=A0ABX5M0S1_9GAMM|nr:hypothetical protein [Pokkaliibacter plantistimulans]PXF32087.1 hypothetical protein WH50_06410 [Pokkaliibacter plantistimulans]